jgi:hypothetical protein
MRAIFPAGGFADANTTVREAKNALRILLKVQSGRRNQVPSPRQIFAHSLLFSTAYRSLTRKNAVSMVRAALKGGGVFPAVFLRGDRSNG